MGCMTSKRGYPIACLSTRLSLTLHANVAKHIDPEKAAMCARISIPIGGGSGQSLVRQRDSSPRAAAPMSR